MPVRLAPRTEGWLLVTRQCSRYDGAMLKRIPLLFALICASQLIASEASDETQIWNLEKAYWEYVKANDLEKYRALWYDDFVGWPSVSEAPVRKDHITDWITNNTSKGLKLQSYAIEQLAVRVTGDVAIDHYRIKADWAKGDASDVLRTDAVRITHTWMRIGNTWQIIGGMSAPVNADGK
jgi:ketosteroid isomerase-like protein